MNVLVAYASKYGSTKEIAERIAQQLQDHGLQALARPVQDLDDLVDYDAFVVGSAVFGGHWMPEATEFVRNNRALLAHGPVWLFSSGPIGTTAKSTTRQPIPRSSGNCGGRFVPGTIGSSSAPGIPAGWTAAGSGSPSG
jgi:menaquinone-dependent protoporphyrinogen IX oxidase